VACGVACAPQGSGFEQDCSQCHDPETRKRWGCDEPAAEPVTTLRPCPFCAGERETCAHCGGTNEVPIYRCPNRIATRRELDCVAACVLTERGILPDRGGWQDQAATFTQAWPIVMREVDHWRQVAQKQAMRQAEQQRRRR
jgi:hypothetical protein